MTKNQSSLEKCTRLVVEETKPGAPQVTFSMRCASKQAQSWGKCGLCWLGSLHLALSWIFLMASVLPWLERTQLTQCFLLLPNPSWCWGLPYSLNPASLLPPGMALSHPTCAALRGVPRSLPGAEPLTQAQCLLQAPGSSLGGGCSHPAAKRLLTYQIYSRSLSARS